MDPEILLERAREELDELPPSRERSLAIIKVEEAEMWLERARKNQIASAEPAATNFVDRVHAEQRRIDAQGR